jgi:hypothetical protein
VAGARIIVPTLANTKDPDSEDRKMNDPVDSVQINDLPDEILLHIQKQQAIPEIQLPTHPESTYLNRYTPPAKALRCVCRRWKELVDLRSNYHTRITTAVIRLQTRGDSRCYGRETFRTHLEESRSLLAVLFVVIPKGGTSVPESLSNRLVEECAIEMHHLVGYGGRLIQLEADFGKWQSDALTQHLFTALRSLGTHGMLVHLNIKCEGSNFGVEHAKSSSTDSWPALEEMLEHLPSLRKLQIVDLRNWMPEMEGTGRIRLRLPQTLTSLSLEVDLRSFRELLTSCTGLTHLKLYLPGKIFDESQHRDQVEMNSLVSLQLEGHAIGVTGILSSLRCNCVERVILELLDSPNDDGSYDHLEGSGLPNSSSFLSLKSLIVQGHLLPAVSTLAAISIPDYRVLQLLRITVRGQFGPRVEFPVILPDLVGRVPAYRFEIAAEGPTCAALLKAYPHSNTVRHLRVMITSRKDRDPLDEGLRLSYTRLLSFSIVAGEVSQIQELISHVDIDTVERLPYCTRQPAGPHNRPCQILTATPHIDPL